MGFNASYNYIGKTTTKTVRKPIFRLPDVQSPRASIRFPRRSKSDGSSSKLQLVEALKVVESPKKSPESKGSALSNDDHNNCTLIFIRHHVFVVIKYVVN